MPAVPTKALEEAVSSDFLQIEGDVFRVVKEGRKKALVPVRVRVGVNPLNLITAAAAGLAGVLAATVAWHGVRLPSPLGGDITIFPGLKDTQFGTDINRWYERSKVRRSGGEIVESSKEVLTPEEIQDLLIEQIGDTTCQLLNREWQMAIRSGKTEEAARFLQQARDGGCPWARGR